MNKFRSLIVFYFVILAGQVIAQEAYLRLDSVVIVSDTLQMTTVASTTFSIDQQLTKNLSTGQLVKVRNASLQFFKSSGQIDAFTYYTISNFGILCNGNIILDASSAVEGDIHGNGKGYPIDLRYFKSRYRAFNSRPDLFFSDNLVFTMSCDGSTYITNTITYRLELVYYSYE